ncbi:hypothetical protein FHX40_1666 [Thermopolyspora flexuosa]|jgi:hypothetical protein|uniref:Uncharacterized protein n=1 Tax=Thermopolyspora flexuosa TaxID=103836 RepID=A0A543IWQ0_9ACTN|nr:hypothetical protein FHX40_1666 [Thermopolyspora flexuosa]
MGAIGRIDEGAGEVAARRGAGSYGEPYRMPP